MNTEEIQDLLEQSKVEVTKGNYEEAIRLVDLVIKQTTPESEQHVFALLVFANALERKGDYEQSIEQSQKALHIAEANSYLNDLTIAQSLLGITIYIKDAMIRHLSITIKH